MNVYTELCANLRSHILQLKSDGNEVIKDSIVPTWLLNAQYFDIKFNPIESSRYII
jgi:hypothetical protein